MSGMCPRMGRAEKGRGQEVSEVSAGSLAWLNHLNAFWPV